MSLSSHIFLAEMLVLPNKLSIIDYKDSKLVGSLLSELQIRILD